jgi:MtN3 and saliva related transmembrane protein
MTCFFTGIIAAVFTTMALLPQVIKAHQTKHTKDVSLLMFIITSIGVTLWIVYGFMLGAIPVIAANSATLMLSLYIVYLKVKYG